eukprot:scaffold7852_cov151-Skeletonema_menzelii.AAC.11
MPALRPPSGPDEDYACFGGGCGVSRAIPAFELRLRHASKVGPRGPKYSTRATISSVALLGVLIIIFISKRSCSLLQRRLPPAIDTVGST